MIVKRTLLFFTASLLVWATLLRSDNSKTTEIIATPVQVTQSAAPIPAAATIEQASTKTWTVKTNDNLATIFPKVGVPQRTLAALLKTDAGSALKSLRPGQTIEFNWDDDNTALNKLVYQRSPTIKYEFSLQPNKEYESVRIESPVDKVVRFTKGKIQSSLFLDGQQAGLDTKLILSLADIFSWDIDFAQDLRPGDEFNLLYEMHYVDGELIDSGNILYAEFQNRSNTHKAVRYTSSQGVNSYYSPEGTNLRKAFIRSPVKFTRISSKFNLQRKHPVLHKIRAHKGVDYAAPRGTPVKATSEGKIVYAARKGGYGNVVEIQHGHGYKTLYAHLDRFAKKAKSGNSVKQGQIIGYVGSTGLATGPHCHYELHINGRHRNPLTAPLPKGKSISGDELERFKTLSRQTMALFSLHQQVMLAQNDL